MNPLGIAGVIHLSSVPEASTLSMLFGAALMGLGMAGYRRWFRKPEEEEIGQRGSR